VHICQQSALPFKGVLHAYLQGKISKLLKTIIVDDSVNGNAPTKEEAMVLCLPLARVRKRLFDMAT
jgi:hypothetical protein